MSFAITLSRTNKKNEFESVRFEPHPPKILPTALEARHWGATYALYRVSIQALGCVLRIHFRFLVLQWHTAQSCAPTRAARLLERTCRRT